MKIKSSRILLPVLFLFSACGPTVQYIGKSYPATTHVDVFFNLTDVKKEYEVMGKIDGKGYEFTDFQKIQERIVAEAEKKGADAVVISDMKEQAVNVSKNTTTTSSGQATDNGYNSSSATITTTNSQTIKVLQAEFLKYK